jgi:hypothetical protein
MAAVMAGVLALSVATVSFFAASTNNVDSTLTVHENSLLLEDGVLATISGSGSPYMLSPTGFSDSIDMFVDGTDLVMELGADVKDGYQVGLNLTGAKWFFRNNDGDDAVTIGNIQAFTTLINTGYANEVASYVAGQSYNVYSSSKDAFEALPANLFSYDSDKGIFVPATPSKEGAYFRKIDYNPWTTSNVSVRPRSIISNTPVEVAYKLAVDSQNSSNAVLTILGNYNLNEALGTKWVIRVPLVTLIGDSSSASVIIDSGNQSTIASGKFKFAETGSGKTLTEIASIVTGYDKFDLDDITIAELGAGTIRNGEVIELELPYGYHFSTVTDLNKTIGVYLEGISWAGGTGEGVLGTDFTYEFVPITYNRDKLSGAATATIRDSILQIDLNGIIPTDQLKGKIYISGLSIYAGKEVSDLAIGSEENIELTVRGNNVTEQTIVAAKRVNYNLALSVTSKKIPKLVSGRYIGASYSGVDAQDNIHKTASVRLSENVSQSWWGARYTILSLPAGAKFRKIKITDYDKISDNLYVTDDSNLYGSGLIKDGVYFNDAEQHGSVEVDGSQIIFYDIHITGRSYIDIDMWVSIEYGFAKTNKELTLKIDEKSTTGYTGISDQSVVIADVVDPVTVTTSITDLKIGYQYQPTADIIISETDAGMLLRDKTVLVSITDMFAQDFAFAGDIKIDVTGGDIKIKNILTNKLGGFTTQSGSTLNNTQSGTIAFDIDKQSTTASTVTISGIGVKVDRTVPVTNKESYRAVVWGTAIAENYGIRDPHGNVWKSSFDTPGELVPYVNIVSSADDVTGILTQEVRVTIGQTYYTVNGKTFTMDAAAYISTASNSTMVPVRFVANALGISDNAIVWDDSTKTATIFAKETTVQFTLGKTAMIVNGVSVNMLSPDNLPVAAEIKADRMYLPFRAIGNAFGVPVTWDATTSTAIYNEGANVNK